MRWIIGICAFIGILVFAPLIENCCERLFDGSHKKVKNGVFTVRCSIILIAFAIIINFIFAAIIIFCAFTIYSLPETPIILGTGALICLVFSICVYILIRNKLIVREDDIRVYILFKKAKNISYSDIEEIYICGNVFIFIKGEVKPAVMVANMVGIEMLKAILDTKCADKIKYEICNTREKIKERKNILQQKTPKNIDIDP